MRPGTKPKPSAVKKLTGNPGKRALNKQEPKLPRDKPVCPEFLNAVAKAEWQRLVDVLHETGVITGVDMAVLAAYCMAYSRYIDVEMILEDEPLTYTTDKGNLVQSPYVGMANQLRLQVVKIAAELGITPSSRSRVNAIPNDKENELERLLFGAQVKVKRT